MLNERSLKALQGVHPDLVRVVHRADELTDLQFIIIVNIQILVQDTVISCLAILSEAKSGSGNCSRRV